MRSSSASLPCRSICRCCGTWASWSRGATAGRRCIEAIRKRFARFTIGAGCSRSTGADSSGGSRHTRRRIDDTDTCGKPDIYHHRRNRRSRLVGADVPVPAGEHGPAQRDTGGRALADGVGSASRRPLVSRPRRRRRASVGLRAEHQAAGPAGDLGAAVHVDGRDVEPALSVERNSRGNAHQVHAHGGRAISGRSSAADGVGMDGAARARSQGR